MDNKNVIPRIILIGFVIGNLLFALSSLFGENVSDFARGLCLGIYLVLALGGGAYIIDRVIHKRPLL